MGHKAVFVAKGNLPPGVKAREAGVDVRNDFTFSPLKLITEARRLADIFREIDANVVCAQRAAGMNLALAARGLMRGPGPAIVRARIDTRPVRSGFANRRIYGKMVDGVAAANRACASRHIDALGMEKNRVRVLIGGVDVAFFKPDETARELKTEWGVPVDAPLVGMVARLDFVKGQDDFIDMAALVARDFPEARFALIGKEINVKVNNLKERAASRGVGDRVFFVGERPDINRCVASLDVGVVASTGSEALSRVALEYMACGVPVVGTEVGGIPDVIEDGVVGRMVPPARPEKMADAIKEILGNPDDASRMGAGGRKRTVDLYSREKFAEATVEFYKELIESRTETSGK